MQHEFFWDIADRVSYVDEDPLPSDDVIIDERNEITIEFTYPLAKPIRRTFTSPEGFTRQAFCMAVSDGYEALYDEENKTRTTSPEPQGFLINRSKTDGIHGIWGHDINDLVLEYADRDASGIWHLAVGS